MHLLPNSTEILSHQIPGYDWSYALTGAGVVIVLAIEQIVLLIGSNGPNNEEDLKLKKMETPHQDYTILTDSDDHDHNHDHKIRSYSVDPQHDEDHYGVSRHVERHASHDHAEHEHILNNVLNSNGLKTLITAYVLELSIAVHSVIIGVDLGLMSDPNNYITVLCLLVALSFHQFVEGIGLGSAIQASRGSLGDGKVIGFIFIFSLTMPLGIVIGILTSSGKSSSTQEIAKGVADSTAAGSLLFISLSEMVANYFGASDLVKYPKLRMSMLASFSLGVLLMAIIAIWA